MDSTRDATPAGLLARGDPPRRGHFVGRRMLLGAGLTALAGTAAGCTGEPGRRASSSGELDPADWDSVRAQFALDPGLAHFAAFVLASHPAPVRAAIERHRGGLDSDTDGYLHENADLEEDARRAAAEYLGTQPDRLALTDSTTMGMGLVCGGLGLVPRQEVLTTEHDFPGTYAALGYLSRRTGASVRRVALYDDPAGANAGDIVSRLRAGIGPTTRVVVITWVHSSTGVRLPVSAIAAMLADVNADRDPADRALLVVDGVHGLGAVDESVSELGCDYFTAGTHKWLHGPRGTGVLWGRTWEDVAPLISTFSTAPGPGPAATPGGYHSFEHRWALTEAVEFHQSIGRGRVAARIREQASTLKEGLASIGSVRLITPSDPDLSAGLVLCEIDGMPPDTAVETLRTEHDIVASASPYAESYLRFGPGIMTTPEQVDQVVKAVATLV